MTLKTAGLLAFVGMLLLTFLAAIDFVNALIGLSRDVVPAVVMLRSLIYLIGAVLVMVFFYVFARGQAR